MSEEMLKIAGAIAGAIGIITTLVFIIFREIIRKKIFPQLTKTQAYRVLVTIILLSFILGCWGIYAWLLHEGDRQPRAFKRLAIYRDSVPWKLVSVEIPNKKFVDYTNATGEIELPLNFSAGESVKLLINGQYTATLQNGQAQQTIYIQTPRYQESEIAGEILYGGKPAAGVKLLTEYNDSTVTDRMGRFRFRVKSRVGQDRIALVYSKGRQERKVVVQINQTNLTFDL
jgi:hypothetical protein